jgi:hypothetical protein
MPNSDIGLGKLDRLHWLFLPVEPRMHGAQETPVSLIATLGFRVRYYKRVITPEQRLCRHRHIEYPLAIPSHRNKS